MVICLDKANPLAKEFVLTVRDSIVRKYKHAKINIKTISDFINENASAINQRKPRQLF
jgi:hypothetical protein